MERPTPRIQEVLLEEKCLYAVLFFFLMFLKKINFYVFAQ